MGKAKKRAKATTRPQASSASPGAGQPAVQVPPNQAEQLLAQACALHQAGQLEPAAQAYRASLAAEPNQVNGWRNLGALLRRMGQLQESCQCTERALQLTPDDASLLGNYGNVLRDLGRLEDSLAAFQRACGLEPQNAALVLGEAITLARLQRHQAVVQLLQPLAEHYEGLEPGLRSELLMELGNAHHRLGQFPLALQRWEQGAGLCGGEKRLQLSLNKAQTLCEQKRYSEAEQICTALAADFPDHADLCYARGAIAKARGALKQAFELFERTLELNPDHVICLNSYGLMLRDLGRSHQARRCFERCVELQPGFGAAMNNLGSVLKDVARYDEALGWLRRGAEAMGDNAGAHSNVLFTLVGYELEPAEQRYAEARRFAERFAKAPFERWKDRVLDPDPQRRLRVGLVSPDFCRHAVSYFVEPLLEQWDRRSLEITLYGCGTIHDDYTRRLQRKADQWRDLNGLTDEQAVAQILRDEIDILVDLAGHTAGNRLALFAAKPAPIQATYLGYYGTTGLSEVDYWITDAVLHPPECDGDDPCSETRWRLPRSYVSFRPLPDAPPVQDPPLLRRGQVTFGSFNQSRKITPQTARHWIAALEAVPGSRLLLKSKNLGEPVEAERIRDLFADLGLDPARLELRGHAPSLGEHLAAYHDVDIALDTFPYTGCTTTADALWMGVPVLTVAGGSMVSRQAASVLAAVGRPEWICTTSDELVQRVRALLADDGQQLLQLRREQRSRVAASQLLDHQGLAQAMAGSFRQWWHRWLEQQKLPLEGVQAWRETPSPGGWKAAPLAEAVPLANSPRWPLPLVQADPARLAAWGYESWPAADLEPTGCGQGAKIGPADLWQRQRGSRAAGRPLVLVADPDQALRPEWWNWLYPQRPLLPLNEQGEALRQRLAQLLQP